MKSPVSTKPRVTQLDVVRGSITRYFIKPISRYQVIEINLEQYNMFKDNPYYVTVKMPWIVAGNLFPSVVNGRPVPSIEEQNKKIIEFYGKRMPELKRKLKNLLEFSSPTVNTPT